MNNPKDLLTFLECAEQNCISGNIMEYPQLIPACKWAFEEITRLRQEAAVIAKLHARMYKLFKKE